MGKFEVRIIILNLVNYLGFVIHAYAISLNQIHYLLNSSKTLFPYVYLLNK